MNQYRVLLILDQFSSLHRPTPEETHPRTFLLRHDGKCGEGKAEKSWKTEKKSERQRVVSESTVDTRQTSQTEESERRNVLLGFYS